MSLKVMTVVGTRPEIIRLAAIIEALEAYSDHVLVHTGQNYDDELNAFFFRDLQLRAPDYYLNCDTSSLGAVYGDVLRGTERVLQQEQPDALVVLGDTNSAIAALMARRMKVPVYHLEAGNRSFDPNVPEEINRHLVDHIADYNLVYTENSRKNLLAEGLPAERVILMGSPMREVLAKHRDAIAQSTILQTLGLTPGEFILASTHREENVDLPSRLDQVVNSLAAVAEHFDMPVLVSTHPRTRKRLDALDRTIPDNLRFHPPLGFLDYNHLQQHAKIVISDSGTISEESTMLGFPAVTLRDAIERPEAIDTGAIICTGLDPNDVIDACTITLAQWEKYGKTVCPPDYQVEDTSRRVVNLIRSTATIYHARRAIRTAK
ncbi:MAG: UDP-N-acetylglucosamine 2-epimerase (non-hydrolyzing) [Bowdeniella nasicola]|nr:UDP-N-acetylglucosamine 2-epimerase (non-hydrolyzing) [Bowdeniella nasicola]